MQHCCAIGWVLIVIIIGLFGALAFFTNLLRDDVSPTYTGTRPFSLSRVQFGIWTAVIACTYCYIAFCGQCKAITDLGFNTTVLALMGISAGTAAVGSAIDKGEDPTKRHQNDGSQGIILDILSDNNGVSLHRFQNVVWTIISIAVFLSLVCHGACNCELPKLDNTLLTLMGISSGAYVGLKAGENKNK